MKCWDKVAPVQLNKKEEQNAPLLLLRKFLLNQFDKSLENTLFLVRHELIIFNSSQFVYVHKVRIYGILFKTALFYWE